MAWYRIYWVDERSYSPDCYGYADARKAALAETGALGRFRIVPAAF